MRIHATGATFYEDGSRGTLLDFQWDISWKTLVKNGQVLDLIKIVLNLYVF